MSCDQAMHKSPDPDLSPLVTTKGKPVAADLPPDLLSSMPVKILQDILERLPHRTILNVVKVSRWFRDIARPYVWKTLHVQRRLYGLLIPSNANRGPQYQRLVEKIVEYTRSLTINVPKEDRRFYHWTAGNLPAFLRDVQKARLRELCIIGGELREREISAVEWFLNDPSRTEFR
ncbi:hypothetical protein M011DRAFT_477088 [Sporormia fimetaria CBS 119925]|uniref:F-box domain-containing protein n=1 Tax=Sporormia fimetaria CBS 119925 TaxID=1340428 RepID=A0A6A6VE71_9PLEO|nr:hypothetical protein M011DRAFT_477088 [Sporormia fimetaria CBS 119925]